MRMMVKLFGTGFSRDEDGDCECYNDHDDSEKVETQLSLGTVYNQLMGPSAVRTCRL